MSAPRRRIVRPSPAITSVQSQQRLEKLRRRLFVERDCLRRWMTRLKRAFHAVERSQQRISRIERTLARTED